MATEKNKAPTETTDKKPKESFKLIIWLSFGFVLLCVLGYLGFLVCVSWPISEWSVSKAASLGDSFGILSSLFSGLAFAGLIVTIVMQNKTLKLQMEELREARVVSELQKDAIVGQKEVMDMQLASIHQQQFETTFFKLLDIYEKSTDEISGGASGLRLKELADSDIENLEGRSYLVHIGKFFTNAINEPYEMVYRKYASKVWTTKIHNHIDLILYVLKYVDGKDDYIQLFLSRVPIECYFIIGFELYVREDHALIDIVIKNRMFRGLELNFKDESISESSFLRTIFEKYPENVFAPSFVDKV